MGRTLPILTSNKRCEMTHKMGGEVIKETSTAWPLAI